MRGQNKHNPEDAVSSDTKRFSDQVLTSVGCFSATKWTPCHSEAAISYLYVCVEHTHSTISVLMAVVLYSAYVMAPIK